MTSFERIVILTGAGLSAESGLATFRDRDGIWTRYDLTEVATPEAFAADPVRVHAFYNERRRGLREVAPNTAHLALTRLEREHRGKVTVITQNIDALHEAAGTQRLIHMHGELLKALCARCEARRPWHDDLSIEATCPACGRAGGLRPDVVWFGEMPYHMDEIYDLLQEADLFASIGTSGTVYPAAGFVREARTSGAHTTELNLEPSEGATLFAEAIHGPATRIVPEWVDRILEGPVKSSAP